MKNFHSGLCWRPTGPPWVLGACPLRVVYLSLAPRWERNRRGGGTRKGGLTLPSAQAGAWASLALQSRREKWPNSPVLSYMPATQLLPRHLTVPIYHVNPPEIFFFTFAFCVLSLTYMTVAEHILPKIVRDTFRGPYRLHVGFACTIEPVKTVSKGCCLPGNSLVWTELLGFCLHGIYVLIWVFNFIFTL